MSRWKVVITDRNGKDVGIECKGAVEAGAVAFEWARRRHGRSITPHPVTDASGRPLGLIAGRDIASVNVVETP